METVGYSDYVCEDEMESMVLLDSLMDSSDYEFNSSGSLTNSLSPEEDDSEFNHIVPIVKATTIPKRVRRNRKKLPPKSVAHLPAIRILKSDIRRRYAEMVMKVMNEYDVSMMDQFLHDFCSPEFRFSDIIPVISREQPPNYIDGLENIIKSWAYCFEIMPDCVFHLSNAQFIKTLGKDSTRVVCKARLTGTKLYKAKNPLIEKPKQAIQNKKNQTEEYSVMQQICAVGNHLKHLHLRPQSRSNSESSLTDFTNNDYFHSIQSMNDVLQLCAMEKPVRVYVEGVFVFHLDQFNRFTRLQNDCELYEEIHDFQKK